MYYYKRRDCSCTRARCDLGGDCLLGAITEGEGDPLEQVHAARLLAEQLQAADVLVEVVTRQVEAPVAGDLAMA